MSTFTLEELQGLGLGDSLRVGPQWIPPATRGTPIVERGPHGMPLAPPLTEREGGGLRWWSESLYQKGQWLPKQSVVGVYGLGQSGRIIPSAEDKHRLTKQVDQVYGFVKDKTIPFANRRPAIQAMRSELAKYERWTDSSWGWAWGVPFAGKSYSSYGDLLGKLGAVHNLELVQAGKVHPSAVNADGSPRVDSPTGAAVQSLKEDWDQGTLVTVPSLPSLPKLVGFGAIVLAIGAAGLVAYGFGKGAGGRAVEAVAGGKSDRQENPSKRRARYQVRVGKRVEGHFVSGNEAKDHARELRAAGRRARVVRMKKRS